jgi:hypothetical protein
MPYEMPDLIVLSQNDYKANKEHQCCAAQCPRGGIIKPGDRYRRYVYEDEKGIFITEKVHLSCLYDATT